MLASSLGGSKVKYAKRPKHYEKSVSADRKQEEICSISVKLFYVCVYIYTQMLYIHLISFTIKKTHEKQLQSPYDFYYPLPAITWVRM